MKRCISCGTSFGSAGWTCPSCGFSPEANGALRFTPEAAEGHEGFDAVSFDLLPTVEDESFWFRARSRLIVWALRSACADLRSFVEIGSGTGYVLRDVRSAFPGARLVAAEPSLAGLDVTRTRVPDAELLQVDARTLPFEAEFDAAGAFDVLEHIDDDERVLAELRRTLRPGGKLLVTVPQHARLWAAADEFARHRRRYSRRELRSKLERAGFRVERTTSFVSLLLPALALSRARSRRLDASYDPLAEYRSTQSLRRALEAVMTAERLLIRSGVSLPAGGSLLAVAARSR